MTLKEPDQWKPTKQAARHALGMTIGETRRCLHLAGQCKDTVRFGKTKADFGPASVAIRLMLSSRPRPVGRRRGNLEAGQTSP
jgi:hypothetical protein